MKRTLLFALLLCGIARFANAQAVPQRSKPQNNPAVGRASFTAKMDKAPSTQAKVTNPGSRPGFRAVMDKKPSAAPIGK